ncbi:porin [Chromobacterium sp. IIBBL 290-4]|uniref:porin n=1 Tax=Chromobacterium sp. IIBBL 290-4 TaxID=2953890 RepID=UPI0020B6D1E2|nr:porin [Chromobacterium sp. IIBBL 290-4]UTH73005.1 porin [Chromobacterium sp. IIBBL 290-4]
MKKMILAACSAAMLPALAQAEVSIYGSIRAGLSVVKDNPNNFRSTFGVDDYGSRIGFKGGDDLGNGLKGIWQVETGFHVDGMPDTGTGSGILANRESFLGVQGNFGKIRIGHVTDILSDTEATDKLTAPRRDYTMAMFPLYEKTELFGSYGDGRFKNSVRFDSADYAGFNLALQYGAGEKQAAGQMKQDNFWSSRLEYKRAGFFGAWAYANKLNTVADHNSVINRLQFGYDANNLYLAATYQDVDFWGDAWAKKEGKLILPGVASTGIAPSGRNHLQNHDWALNAGYTIGNYTPWAMFSRRGDAKVDGARIENSSANQWALALDYKASKATLLRAGFGQIKQGEGARKAFAWTDTTASSYWAMIKHSF